MKTKTPRSDRMKWTDKQDAKLKLLKRTHTNKQIAIKMNITVMAVKSRWQKLNARKVEKSANRTSKKATAKYQENFKKKVEAKSEFSYRDQVAYLEDQEQMEAISKPKSKTSAWNRFKNWLSS